MFRPYLYMIRLNLYVIRPYLMRLCIIWPYQYTIRPYPVRLYLNTGSAFHWSVFLVFGLYWDVGTHSSLPCTVLWDYTYTLSDNTLWDYAWSDHTYTCSYHTLWDYTWPDHTYTWSVHTLWDYTCSDHTRFPVAGLMPNILKVWVYILFKALFINYCNGSTNKHYEE